jgi:hypothetical protein
MMKFTVRAFVFALALTGMAATSVSTASTLNKTKTAMLTQPGSPAPVCAPSDPSHCGMD